MLLLTAGAGTTHADSVTRTSAFEYDASGLLIKEIIEPDNSQLCLVTTYGYDTFGNKTSATVRNCNGGSGEAAAPSGDAVITPRTSSSPLGSAIGHRGQCLTLHQRLKVRCKVTH